MKTEVVAIGNRCDSDLVGKHVRWWESPSSDRRHQPDVEGVVLAVGIDRSGAVMVVRVTRDGTGFYEHYHVGRIVELSPGGNYLEVVDDPATPAVDHGVDYYMPPQPVIERGEIRRALMRQRADMRVLLEPLARTVRQLQQRAVVLVDEMNEKDLLGLECAQQVELEDVRHRMSLAARALADTILGKED